MMNKNSRNTGIDIMKIISMYMVLVLHICGRGGVRDSLEQGSLAWNMVWLLDIACDVAVNCFALVTGYLMVERKIKWSNLLLLWLQVAFYSVSIMALFAVFSPDVLTVRSVFSGFLPIMGQQYWYFTAYFAMYAVLPYVNRLIKTLSKREYAVFILILLVLLSIMNTASFTDCFEIKYGYSAVWLLTMYLVGGYIKKFGLFNCSCNMLYIGYIVSIVITWATKIFSARIPILNVQGTAVNSIFVYLSSALIAYTSPTIVIASIFLFCAVIRTKFKSFSMISTVSQMSFSVYLIHSHPLVFDNLFAGAFIFITKVDILLYYPLILLVAFLIFALCLCVEKLRISIFRLCNIDRLVNLLYEKIELKS